MCARVVQASVRPGILEEFLAEFRRGFVPALKREKGFEQVFVLTDANSVQAQPPLDPGVAPLALLHVMSTIAIDRSRRSSAAARTNGSSVTIKSAALRMAIVE